MSKAVVAAAAVLGLAAYLFIYSTDRADKPIRSDGFSYYVYLPAWFIFHDPSLRAVSRDCCGGEFPQYTAIIRWPGTRRWVNAHPIGVAIMQAPFFFAAHLLTLWTNLSPDGFSFYYQHAAGLAGLFWMVAGLAVLRLLLRRQFTEPVTAATLVALLFGTNLFHYGTYDSSYSHVYSFFLFSAFMLLTERWHRSPTRKVSFLLGIVAGLIVLTRHTNALFLIVFPLYVIGSAPTMRLGLTPLREQWREVAAAGSAAAVVLGPQLAMYYHATGQLLVNSYGSLGFNFSEPRIFGVLFSVRRGLFFWSPLLLLGVAGLVKSRGMTRAFALPAALILAVNTYLIASWWDWQFGASYGHRGFVDSLPLLALGVATVFERVAAAPRMHLVTATVVSAAVSLSVFQMLQYWNGVMPMSDMTWQQYRAIFLRPR
jgi:hypothetical protein